MQLQFVLNLGRDNKCASCIHVFGLKKDYSLQSLDLYECLCAVIMPNSSVKVLDIF